MKSGRHFCRPVLFLFARIIAIYQAIAGNRFLPIRAFGNSIPLRFRTAVMDDRESGAIIERRITYTRYTIRYRHTRKVGAVPERTLTYARYAVRYCKVTIGFSARIDN